MNANTFKTIKDIALSHHWQMIVLVYINDIFLKTNSMIPMTSVSEANSLLKNIKREDEKWYFCHLKCVVKDRYFFRKIEAIFTIANELYDQL